MQDRKKYLFYNMGVWIVILIAGLMLLIFARHYGTIYRENHEALSFVFEAETAHNDGRVDDAQRNLLLAFAKSPQIGNSIIERFSMKLLGMPSVMAKFKKQGSISGDTVFSSDLSIKNSILFQFVEGKNNIGLNSLSPLMHYADDKPILNLWAARICRENVDFALAEEYFNAYWSVYPEECEAMINELMETIGSETSKEIDAKCLRLFEAGLWQEAFKEVDEAQNNGNNSHSLVFLSGVHKDISGNTKMAISDYQYVLKIQPNHLLALKRLNKLMAVSS